MPLKQITTEYSTCNTAQMKKEMAAHEMTLTIYVGLVKKLHTKFPSIKDALCKKRYNNIVVKDITFHNKKYSFTCKSRCLLD